MHSVNFSFNLKLSIQKHKYSLPHFSSNQTNTKADTNTERERERERERDSSTNPIKLAKAELNKDWARCNPCFSKSFSRETNRSQGKRESSYLMDERGEIGLDEQKAVERSIFFFFFHFLTPILFFLWKSEILFHIQGFRERSTLFHSGGVGRSGC